MTTKTGTSSQGQAVREVPRTTAYSKFLCDWGELIGFDLSVVLVIRHASMSSSIPDPLSKESDIDPILEEAVDLLGGCPLETLGMCQELLTHLLVPRFVDDYLTYLSDLLSIIFRTKPEMLRSQETVSMSDILERDTLQALITTVTERKVNTLSYKGLNELNAYLKGQFGFAVSDDLETLTKLTNIVEVCNLIAHNQGIVNRHFCSRVEGYMASDCGKLLFIGHHNVIRWAKFLKRCAEDLDARAVEKFHLPVSYTSMHGSHEGTVPAPKV